MSTVHAYIADLPRDLRKTVCAVNGALLENLAVSADCGKWVTAGRNDDDLRVFGLLRLATIWPLMGHHVTCPACRLRVRSILAERDGDPGRQARIKALAEWATINMPADERGQLERASHRAHRLDVMRLYRERKRAERAGSMGECRYCQEPISVASHATTCGRTACRVKRAIEVRKARKGT